MLGPTTISSSANPIGDHVIRKFETSLQGEIIRPSHARYELARKGWIGLVDPRRPATLIPKAPCGLDSSDAVSANAGLEHHPASN
jgi:hypothetical protein